MGSSQNNKKILQQILPVIGITIGAAVGLILGFLFDESLFKRRQVNKRGEDAQ